MGVGCYAWNARSVGAQTRLDVSAFTHSSVQPAFDRTHILRSNIRHIFYCHPLPTLDSQALRVLVYLSSLSSHRLAQVVQDVEQFQYTLLTATIQPRS